MQLTLISNLDGMEVATPRNRKLKPSMVRRGVGRITKKARLEFLRTKIASERAWALRALEVVYLNQTPYERSSGHTKEYNGKGFSSMDSGFLSSLAQQSRRTSGHLSPKQMKHLYKIMPKYSGQVLEVSDLRKLDNLITKYRKENNEGNTEA